MAKFEGFPPQTLAFLRGLGKHNDKAWFDAHRADYEAYYIEPAKAFVAALGDKLAALAPAITAEPKVNGSIFRINRDIRFSKDKTPYKDHLDLWFWDGSERKAAVSGFFFRLRHDSVLLGAGNHTFDKDQLATFRAAVLDDETGKPLATLGRKLAKAGMPLSGEAYKKVPRGVDPEHPRADLLKFGALHAGVTLQPRPAELDSAKFVTTCAGHFKKLLPLHRWLVDALQR